MSNTDSRLGIIDLEGHCQHNLVKESIGQTYCLFELDVFFK